MESQFMLSDKPKLVFTDIAGRVTLESTLPVQQIKAQYQPTQAEKFNNALLQCGEALL
jgi:hypothetical protein